MEFIDNTPNAARLMSSLRSSGYDNYAAICDIIDNSFDANADMVKVSLGQNDNTEGGIIITVADNGDGMTEETLKEALKLGSLTVKDAESLGKYGMGLVTASISLGRRLTVITKRDGKYFTGIQDLDDVVEQNKFIKLIRPSTQLEILDFDTRLGGSSSGTVVNIQKVDNLKNRQLNSVQSTLIKKAGQIFRYFLNANKNILVNGKQVLATDPMQLDDDQTQTLIDTTEDFNVHGKMSRIRLRIVMLPMKAESDPSNDQSIQTQGFYLMRNNREIESGTSLNRTASKKMFTKHGYLNRFRAEIFFSSDLDDMMGVSFKKDGSDGIDESIYSWIERLSLPQIQAIRNIATKIGRIKATPTNHAGSSRTISSKGSTLKRPRSDQDPKKTSPIDKIKPEAFTNVKYEIESNTRLASLFQFEIVGGEMKIKYNIDHPFYELVFSEADNNPSLKSAIDFIVYSMTLALIDITSTEERWKLQEEFLDRMSDNLRSLLS